MKVVRILRPILRDLHYWGWLRQQRNSNSSVAPWWWRQHPGLREWFQTLTIISFSWPSAGLLNMLLMLQLMLPVHIPQTSLCSHLWCHTSGITWKPSVSTTTSSCACLHLSPIYNTQKWTVQEDTGKEWKVGCTDAEKRSTHISFSAKSSYIITTICSSGIPFLWTIWYAWQASACKSEKSHEELSEVPFNRLEGRFCDTCPHLVPVVVPAIGAGYDHHPVFPTVWLLGGKRLDHHPETQPEQEQQGWFTHPGLVSFTVVDDTDKHW